MDNEILSWFGNLLNYTIFVYIFTKTIKTSCFNNLDMGLSLFGLGASIIIHIITTINKLGLKTRGKIKNK